MKHILLFTCCLAMSLNAFSQTSIDGGLQYPDPKIEYSMVIPKEYSFTHKPQLSFRKNDDKKQVMVFDENLNMVKTFIINNDRLFEYKVKYQNEERTVTEVKEKVVYKDELNTTYKEWVENSKNADASFSESLLHISKQENGDSIISLDYTNNQYELNNERMYFGYSYFGTKYPVRYWLASKGKFYCIDCTYQASYSEWKPVSTYEETHSYPTYCQHIYNLNLDNGDGTNGSYFDISQTLFNQDDDYEYIIPKLSMSSKCSGDDYPSDEVIPPSTIEGNSLTLTRTVESSDNQYLVMSGFQVVSSNGNIVKDLDFEEEFSLLPEMNCVALITIGGNRYLAFGGNNKTIFYKIESQTSSIKKVSTVSANMFVQPIIANKNANIGVTFSDRNERGSDIIITSTSGQRISSTSVPAGVTQSNVSVNAPAGIYMLSRLQNGKVNETKKIILK